MMRRNKRIRMKEFAMLLAIIICLTPIYGVVSEAVGPFDAEVQMILPETDMDIDVSGADVSNGSTGINDRIGNMEESGDAIPFTLGNVGYYIINGINMVDISDTVFVGEEDGIHWQTGGEEVLLCADVARNLNYGDNKLYYTTVYEDGTYIRVINLETLQIEKTYELEGWEVKHMYLVSCCFWQEVLFLN